MNRAIHLSIGVLIAPQMDCPPRLTIQIESNEPSGIGLCQCHDLVPEETHIDGMAEFARSITFALERAKQFTVGCEQVHCCQLIVQDIDTTLCIRCNIRDRSEEKIIIFIAPSPLFFGNVARQIIGRRR